MESDFLRNYSDIIFCDIIISCITLTMYFLPKKKINYVIGYRTSRSMKNQKNWDFAQRFYFRNWPVSIPLVLLFQGLAVYLTKFENDTIENLSIALFLLYSIALAACTEQKLGKSNN